MTGDQLRANQRSAFVRLLGRLDVLIPLAGTDTPEAEAIRDQMDSPWQQMSEEDQQICRSLDLDGSQAVLITYRNYRGEVSKRRVTPIGPVYLGSTDWHPGEQPLYDVWDHDKRDIRTFALSGTLGFEADPANRCPPVDRNPSIAIEVALTEFVSDINSTGGLVMVDGLDANGFRYAAPVAAPDWTDLGVTYLHACQALRVAPLYQENDEADDDATALIESDEGS